MIEQARDFEHLMISTLLEDGAESGRYAYNQLHPRLAALEAGKAVLFSRCKLPVGHRRSAPEAGRPTDTLELGEDNVVRDLAAKRVFWGR